MGGCSPPLIPAQAGIERWVPAFAGTSGTLALSGSSLRRHWAAEEAGRAEQDEQEQHDERHRLTPLRFEPPQREVLAKAEQQPGARRAAQAAYPAHDGGG